MEWEKEWVWVKGPEAPRNFYVYFRGWFEAGEGVKKVLVHLTADSRYLLYLNGEYQGRGPAKCDPKYQYYDTYKFTPTLPPPSRGRNPGGLLHPGKNLIAVLVHHYGEETFSYLLGRGGFLCQVEVIYRDGLRKIYGTDSSWRTKSAEAWDQNASRTTVQLGFQEIYDARKEPVGWQTPEFDDADWDRPVSLGKPPVLPWENLIPRDIPFLKESALLPQRVVEIGEIAERRDWSNLNLAGLLEDELHLPWDKGKIRDCHVANYASRNDKGLNNLLRRNDRYLEVSVPENGLYLIFDFGKEVTGFPGFTLETGEEGMVDLAYDELLTGNRPHPMRGGGGGCLIRYADRYRVRKGKVAYQNSFTWRGFRYIQIVLRNFQNPVRIYSVGLNSYNYPVRAEGSFLSSDNLTNRIWEIGRYTLHLCMHDSYEDCPWREQTQWWGDGRLQALVNYYAFGDTRLVKKGLRQIAETQERRDDGLMQPFGPGGTYGSPIHPAIKLIPAFCLIWVLSLKDYYLFTADSQVLKKLYPYLTRLMAGFQNFLTDRNLLYFDSQKYWNFIDWAPLDYEGETAALNCYYVGALRTAAEIAESVGDLKNKADYIGQAEKVKSALNRHLWNKEVSLYADGIKGDKLSEVYSQHSNCLAVLFGIAEDEDAVLNNILTKKGLVPVASPYFMFYLLEALFKKNQHRKAYDIIRTRWGEMVSRGATTFWEIFEEPTKSTEGWSLCHAWSSAVTYFLISEYLAVKPLEPGFKKVLIAPKTVGLTRLEGTVPTPSGKIKISWQTEPEFTIGVDLPKGTSGTLVLPDRKPISFTGRFCHSER